MVLNFATYRSSAAIASVLVSVANNVHNGASNVLAKRKEEPTHVSRSLIAFIAERMLTCPKNQVVAGGVLIPVLVLLSGLFAGLTLGVRSSSPLPHITPR